VKYLTGAVGLGLLLVISGTAQAAPVTPNFTTGTVTSHTETTTTVNETIRQIDYHTGNSYTASGTNINMGGRPGVDCPYTIKTPGAAFQFTETSFGPGISRETFIQRTTTIQSVTDSMSVFSQ
jgi:hypothetical protein